MTSDTPTPGPDAPDTTATPGQGLAAELLQGAAIPTTMAATTAASPKLPPYQGD